MRVRGLGAAQGIAGPVRAADERAARGRRPSHWPVHGQLRALGGNRISELLGEGSREFVRGEWVEGEAWRQDPEIGLFVIVERGFVGLVPKHEPQALARGEAARFRVTHLHPDGKIDLALRGHAHEELESDGERILQLLKRPGAPKLGDKSDPELIRELFGLSKKAFKRAVGRLLRERLVDVDEQGFVRVLPG